MVDDEIMTKQQIIKFGSLASTQQLFARQNALFIGVSSESHSRDNRGIELDPSSKNAISRLTDVGSCFKRESTFEDVLRDILAFQDDANI
jgi:hypothetical protein